MNVKDTQGLLKTSFQNERELSLPIGMKVNKLKGELCLLDFEGDAY